MYATRDGSCRGRCGQPIKQGCPIYYTPEDGAWHWDCWEAQPVSLGDIALAEQLGYTKRAAPVPPELDEEWKF